LVDLSDARKVILGMSGLGNFQPFNASGNIYQIARLKSPQLIAVIGEVD
jgi:hypothetical protein